MEHKREGFPLNRSRKWICSFQTFNDGDVYFTSLMDRVYYVFLITFSSFYSRLLFNRNFYINSIQRQFTFIWYATRNFKFSHFFTKMDFLCNVNTFDTLLTFHYTDNFVRSKMSGVKIQTNSTLPQQLDWISRRRNQIAAVILPSACGLGRYWRYYNIGRY
jgi:hypothetical protein